MFVHMSIHKPHPDKESLLIDSMCRFGEVIKKQKGLQRVHQLKDEKTGALIGLAIWDSKEEWEAARPTMQEAIKDDPFEEWEPKPPDVFWLGEV